ncbi:MAG TPA: DUF1800 domain-containing protein [Candidatus Dormibacteraeota bacterium]|nr:DUF1800 domain-containing protein [Candidatus Dormibacteraeota bacterium]
MRLQHSAALRVAILRAARSLLSVVLSIGCVLALDVDFVAPAVAAGHATGARDKRNSQDPTLKGLPITELTTDEAILHALNRLAYGPRPGEIERVRQMGLAKWIEQQLSPQSIDDSTMEARLEKFSTLKMSTPTLLAEYSQPKQDGKQVDDSQKPQRIVEELAMAKVTRAIYSERQLQQVMDDFWFNHFNVFAGKGEDRWYLTSYERDVIQPHALGKFKDLLGATAKSPAMLFYLDNFLSADPKTAERQTALRAMRQHARHARFGRPLPPRPPQAPQKNVRGLNENYGRELMELHTLGVDAGYTQKDVTEVARSFTGWTIERPRESAQFKFDERVHDPDRKVVLGKKIHAGGVKDGEEVIHLLVQHASTAKFISTKLARRFVSDNPPAALVSRMTQTFRSSGGDIRAVMKTMIYSPEFWSPDAHRAKVKTPFELVVSAARALGTDVDSPMPLVQWVGRIGEPLYQCQPPTGYADRADAWVNTGALLNRLNYSLALAENKVRGSRSDVPALLGIDSVSDAKTALDRAVRLFLGGQTAPTTLETLEKQLDNPSVVRAKLDDPVKQVDLGVVAGLVLGAPEFQRR